MPVNVQGVHAQAITWSVLCWCGKRREKTFLDLRIQTRDGLLKLVKRCGSAVARPTHGVLSVHAQ